MRGETAYPDWREAAAYAPLLDADRSLFAWEWLRRDPDYRSCAQAASAAGLRPTRAAPGAKRFGLIAFEPPGLAIPKARPLWRSEVHPFVLTADIRNGAASVDDEIDLSGMSHLVRILAARGTEHLLLSDGLRSIRLDGPRGAFSAGPLCLLYRVEGLASAERPLLTLRRFLALCRTGSFSRSLHPREVRARRWILLLRAHDAFAAGAGQRQIAQELLSSSVAGPRWRSRESSIRSQVQRLVRGARHMASNGCWRLLK